jgi:hypothetical protein
MDTEIENRVAMRSGGRRHMSKTHVLCTCPYFNALKRSPPGVVTKSERHLVPAAFSQNFNLR